MADDLEWKAFAISILRETVKKMKDLPEQVEKIQNELEHLRDSIDKADEVAEAERDDTRRPEKKRRLMQSRKLVYETEDVIEEYNILNRDVPPTAPSLSKAVHYIQTLIPRLQICNKIEDIKGQYPPRSSTSEENQRNPSHQRRWNPLETQEEVVGLVEPTKQLEGLLKSGRKERIVISVVGIPGVGKSTLAKHVFDKFHADFQCYAVIRVSQTYNVKELLMDMIQQLCKEKTPSNISTMSLQQLITEVQCLLSCKRYVFLFDDIWDENFWDGIKNALIDNKNGSRIIITTRLEELGYFCKRSPLVEVYKLKELSDEESFKLFDKRARYGFDEDCPEELKRISLEIVSKCKGLRLAIVVVGDLLAQKEQSAYEWRRFSKEFNFNLKDVAEIIEIIGLSYDRLPINLRLSLLYFGMYPKGYEIKSERLVRQWIAEEFVTPDTQKSLEEVAHEYLLGLVRRNLVQVSSFSVKGKVKKCRLHDLIHEMISRKVKNTYFGEFIGGGHDQSESSEWVRRLTIATNDVIRSFENSLIRSIIITIPEKKVPIKNEIPGNQEESWFGQLESKILTDKMRLKVLDYEDSGIPCVPKMLGDLIHLRYLSFRRTLIESLPKSIGNLLNLETLDIRETKVCKIPKEITKLRKLRHLLTPNCASSSIEWKDIGGMTMLQKIPQVRMEFDEVAIREVGKLKQLRDLRVLYFSGEHKNVLCSSIKKMEHLQALCIETSERSEVVDLNNITLPNSKPIKKLFLDMKLQGLPNWIPELHKLERLTLRHSDLTDDPLESLKDMPCLSLLSLTHAYEGQRLHFQRGGFPKLRKLILSNLWNLNSILIDDHTTLQSLEYFEFTLLDELKTVPEGIQSLQKLNLWRKLIALVKTSTGPSIMGYM